MTENRLEQQFQNRAERNSLEALARQGLASVLDLIVANPEQGSYLPNVVVGLPALAEIPLNLAAMPFTDEPPFRVYSDQVFANLQRSEELAGTGAPRTTAENVARVVPGALLPVPAPRGTGPITNALSEVLIPGLQNPTAAGAALSIGPELVASEAIASVTDPTFQSAVFGGREESIVTPGEPAFDPELDDVPVERPPGMYTLDGVELIPMEDTESDLSGEIAAGLLAILGLVGLRSAVRANRAARSVQEQENVQRLAGATPEQRGRQTTTQQQTTRGGITGPVTGRMTAVETQLIDRDAPLFNALREAGVDEDTYELFRARTLTTAAPQPLSARLHDTAITGQLPNSPVRMPPLANHLEAISRLTPEQRALYNDGLIARTRLDDMNATGTDIWGIGPRAQNRTDLEAIVRAAEDDDIVLSLMNEANTMYQRMADYMLEAGVISADKRAAWATNAEHYSPLQTNFSRDRQLGDVFEALEPSGTPEGLQFLDPRADLLQGVQPGQVAEPMRMHEQYMSKIVRNTENNRIRRDFVDTVMTHGLQDGNGNDIITKVGKQGNDTVTVRRGGVTEYYKITDPAIRNALYFRPQVTAGILNTARRFAQEFTTGTARPDFVPVSLMYEMLSALPMVRSGRGLGPADEALNRLSGMTMADFGLPDPSVVLSPLTGSMRQIAYANFMQGLSRSLDMQLRFDGVVTQAIGPQNTQKLRNVMMNAYERSTYRLFQQYGGGNNIFIENIMQGEVPSVVVDVAPNFARTISDDIATQFRADSFSRTYMMFLNSMHNSIRIQSAAASLSGRGTRIVSDPDEIVRVMADVRQLTGDVTRVGGDPSTVLGRGYQGVLSQSMYANHFVQVLAANARAMRDHPVRYWTTMGLMATGGAAFIMEQLRDNPVAQTHYWNDLTIEQRGQFMPIYEQDGSIKGLVMIPPEQRLLWSPFIESVGTTFGLKSGDPANVRDVHALLDAALSAEWTAQDVGDAKYGFVSTLGRSVLPDPVGPGIRAVAQPLLGTEIPNYATEVTSALTGENIPGGSGRFQGFEPRPNRLETSQNAEIIERGKLIVDALFASSARLMIDSSNALARSLGQGRGVEGSLENASEAFFGPVREPTRTGPAQTMWGLDTRLNVSDATFRELQPKLDTISNVINQAFTQEVVAPQEGTRAPGAQTLSINPNARGTQLEVVGQRAAILQRWISSAYSTPMAALKREMDEIKIDPAFSDPVARRARENAITREMRALNYMALNQVKAYESALSDTLGTPFTFEQFNLNQARERPPIVVE